VWFAPRIFTEGEELSEDAKAFRNEVERRINLHKARSLTAGRGGNRIQVIGYSDNAEVKGLEDILTVPGDFMRTINGERKHGLSVRPLAPIKADTDDDACERNNTSIVMQLTFDPNEESTVVYFGGDAGCPIWERIWAMNRSTAPPWDLFMAPHHCSWHFFSEVSHDDDPEPSASIMELLEHKQDRAVVVASCKPIRDDDDNPPHWAAAQIYRSLVEQDGDRFCWTSETAEGGNPVPLEFRITRQGIQRDGGRQTPHRPSGGVEDFPLVRGVGVQREDDLRAAVGSGAHRHQPSWIHYEPSSTYTPCGPETAVQSTHWATGDLSNAAVRRTMQLQPEKGPPREQAAHPTR